MLTEKAKQNLECVADWLEMLPSSKFNMSFWFSGEDASLVEGTDHETTNCGTTCCIAGWVCLKKGYKMSGEFGYSLAYDKNGERLGAVPNVAAGILGLELHDANKLFLPVCWPESGFPNTPKGAADRIRHFIKTGE